MSDPLLSQTGTNSWKRIDDAAPHGFVQKGPNHYVRAESPNGGTPARGEASEDFFFWLGWAMRIGGFGAFAGIAYYGAIQVLAMLHGGGTVTCHLGK
jgi:hypothetical protein